MNTVVDLKFIPKYDMYNNGECQYHGSDRTDISKKNLHVMCVNSQTKTNLL